MKAECEKSFYKELYELRDGQCLVMDETTQTVYLRKISDNGDEAVFLYLRAHPNRYVPRIQTVWREDGKTVVVEEYIQGRNLLELSADGALPEAQKREIICAVMEAVCFLHGAKPPIIHRDIKPSNIMVTNDGAVKLVDYDAAKVYSGIKERDTELLGTPGVAAPEQYGFAESDVRTDVFAIGVLIREMFGATGIYADVIKKATEISPNNRFATIDELKAAFLSAGNGEEKVTVKTRKRNVHLILGIAACFMFIAMAITAVRVVQSIGERLIAGAGYPDNASGTTSEETGGSGEPTSVGTDDDNADIFSPVGLDDADDVSDLKKAELVDSGYTIEKTGNLTHIYVALQLRNPNKEYAIWLPQIYFTARDAAGNVAATEEMTIFGIAAGDTIYISRDLIYEGQTTATLDIEVITKDDDYFAQETSDICYQRDFVVENASVKEGMSGTTVIGELTNRTGRDIDGYRVDVIYRKNGKLIGGEVGYIGYLGKDKTKAFEITGYRTWDYDTYEVYGQQW